MASCPWTVYCSQCFTIHDVAYRVCHEGCDPSVPLVQIPEPTLSALQSLYLLDVNCLRYVYELEALWKRERKVVHGE